MTGDDPVTVIEGSITDDAEPEDVAVIRDALQECGYAVEIDREDGKITVQHDREQARRELAEKARTAKQGDGDYEPLGADEEESDSSERSDEDDEEDKGLTKRERRIQRLRDGIEEGEPYTSDELCAIAYDIDAAEVGTSERAYLSNLRANGHIDFNDMSDPNGHGNAKLYYRGEQPDVEVPDEQDDQEEPAWTVKRVESVMQGSGWMTTEEIAQGVLDKEEVSYDERDRFHNLLHRKPDLDARITSRPDPDDHRRNQYRFDDAADSDDSTESDSESGCPTNAAGEVQHEGDCPHGVEQEIEEMQDLYQDDEPDRPDPDPEPDEPVPAGTETGDDEDSEDAFTCTACGQQFDTFQGLRDHHCETGDFPCPECDTAFDDDEALQNHLRDKHPGFYGDDPVTHAGTDEDADDGEDDEELLEEMGPCNIGKIMVQGEFDQYVCQECNRTFHDESAADAHADDYNHPTFKAFDQVPDRQKQPAGYVGGGTAR